MTQAKVGNNQFLKEFNRALFLDILRQKGFVSKAELAKITGLSPTASGTIVQSLLEDEYIEDTGIGESSGGRKPVMYSLKKRTYFSVGIDVDVKSANIIIMDITGEQLLYKTIDLSHGITPQLACELLWKETEKLIEALNIPEKRLLGVGISVPGIIDTITSDIIMAPNLGWQNVNLIKKFEKLANVPVYIENEAMASAHCEHWIGSCQNINNFICINIKSGIGAGIFADGRLYKGNGGSAGEIGHVVIDETGPQCGCGKRGCLETLASTKGIINKANILLECCQKDLDVADTNYYSIDCYIEKADAGNDRIRLIFDKSAEYLGIAIADIINTLNPTTVVLGKEFTKYSHLCMDTIKKVVGEKALRYPASQVSIIASEFGDKSSTIGAAILPIMKVFGK